MLKAKSLRAFLTLHVPGLSTNPDRLQLFVDKGGVACHATQTLSYENRYSLQIVITPFAGDIDTLFVPLLAWIAINQPDLLQHWEHKGQHPFGYEVEILDGDEVDLTITLALSERVLVTARASGGGYIAKALDEPQFPDAFDQLGFVLLRRLYGDADVLAETRDEDWLAAHPRP